MTAYESWGAYLPSARVGDVVKGTVVIREVYQHAGNFECDIDTNAPVELLSRARSAGQRAYEQFWAEGGDAEHQSWAELPAEIKATWDKVAQAAKG